MGDPIQVRTLQRKRVQQTREWARFSHDTRFRSSWDTRFPLVRVKVIAVLMA
jgi:hypothetical protein